MKVKVAVFLSMVLLVNTVSAQSDMDGLIGKMADEHWVPGQQSLAEEISDVLLARLHQESLTEVVESLSERSRESINTASLSTDQREINLAVLWHPNRFQSIRFSSEEYADKEEQGADFYPFIQWRRPDGLWVAQSLHTLEGSWPEARTQGDKVNFYEIHPLDSAEHELYLLVGVHPGTQSPALVSFLVIGFDGDQLLFNYPAFEARYPLLQASVYDNEKPGAYFDYFNYDPVNQRISFNNLSRQNRLTVPEDDFRLSSKIVNTRSEKSVLLQFIDGHFRSVTDD